MRSLVRWYPFDELERMNRRMDRLFGDFRPLRLPRIDAEIGYVPLDVSETEEAYEIEATLPGVKSEDIEVQVHGDTVTIKGEAKEEAEEKEKGWLRRERRYGTFARSFTLPTDVDTKKASAEFENGLLKLTLPKSEAEKPKIIKVSTKGAVEGKKS